MHCNQKDLPELTGMQIQWDTKHCCGNMALAGHWHLHLRSQKYCQWDTSNKPNLALRNIKYLKIICEGNENFLYLEGWAIELYDIITHRQNTVSCEHEEGQVILKELPKLFDLVLVNIKSISIESIKDGNDKTIYHFKEGHVQHVRFKTHWWIRFFGRTESEDSRL